MRSRTTYALVAFLCTATTATAQTANTLSGEGRHVAVPAGALTGVDTDGTGGAGAVLGFQVFEKDQDLVGVFFNFAGDKKITGAQRDFGAFLLSPTTDGSSVFAIGEKTFKKGGQSLLAVAGRGGVTFTSWEASTASAPQTVNGFVLYASGGLQWSTKTLKAGENEYQLGVQFGPGVRILGGDLAQADSFVAAPSVLGINRTKFLGIEVAAFARLNEVRPFIRLTFYPVDSKTEGDSSTADINGFSGFQAFLGIDVISALFKSKIGS